MTGQPSIHIAPFVDSNLEQAVVDGGGRVGEIADADALVWTDPFGPGALGELLEGSEVRWVQLPLAGLERFFESGVIDERRTWTCAKGIYGYACAEHAVALMLAAARQIHTHVTQTTWQPAGFDSPHRMINGSTVLIVGTGGIGSWTAKLLAPFQVRILAVNRSGSPMQGAEKTETTSRLGDLIGEADFVVIAAALTDETRGLIDRKMLELMKPSAWLVNVARGGLVDTGDLVEALKAGVIGGAALDVTEPEPLPDDHLLWALDNAIITPHVANTVSMSLPELTDLVRRNVRRFAAGAPLESLVDPSLGY